MSVRIRPVDSQEFEDRPLRHCGRKPVLSRAQRAEVRRRYALHLANTPAKICAEFGIKSSTLAAITGGYRYKDER